MRQWITLVEATLGEAQQHLPQWFQDGRIIGRAGHARQNFLALDKLNVGEFIEDVEFAYEWRFCRVPVASLPKLTKAQIAVLRKMDRNWPERMASVRKLIVKGGGWHRVTAAAEAGLPEIYAIVGLGDRVWNVEEP